MTRKVLCFIIYLTMSLFLSISQAYRQNLHFHFYYMMASIFSIYYGLNISLSPKKYLGDISRSVKYVLPIVTSSGLHLLLKSIRSGNHYLFLVSCLFLLIQLGFLTWEGFRIFKHEARR